MGDLNNARNNEQQLSQALTNAEGQVVNLSNMNNQLQSQNTALGNQTNVLNSEVNQLGSTVQQQNNQLTNAQLANDTLRNSLTAMPYSGLAGLNGFRGINPLTGRPF